MAGNDVRIVVTADAGQAKRELKDVEGSAHKVGSAFGDMAKIAGGFVIGQAITKIPALLGGATSAASDLNESLSKARTVFGDASASVEEFANITTKSMGLSKGAALAATGSFGNLFTAMGLSKQQAASTSIDVVKLAGDLASFHNLNVDDALEKLRAGLVGEAEPLRAMGIQMNAAMVEAKALEMGLVGANGEVSEAGKVQARLAIIMAQTTVAQGDFARTADGAANKQRILSATAADMQAQLGGKLLPAWIAIQDVMLKKVIPAIAKVAEIFGTFIQYIKFTVQEGDSLNDFLANLPGPLQGIAKAVGEVALWIKEMVPKVRELAGSIAEKLQPVLEATIGFLGRHTEILWGVAAAIGVGLVAAFTAWAIAAGAAAVATIAATAPVLAIGVAIAGLVAGVIWLVKNWGDLEDKYPKLKVATEAVKDGFEAFTVWITGTFVPVVKQIAVKVGEVAVEVVAIYNEKIKPVMAAIVDAAAAVVQWFVDHWGDIMRVVGPMIDQVVSGLKLIGTTLEETVKLIGNLITGDWDGAWQNAKNIVGGFETYIKETFENVKKFIVGVIGTLRDIAASVGKGIVNGIREGISDAWDGLMNWIEEQINKIPWVIRKALGISSPSKVMADEVGRPIVAGIAAGIEAEWPKLQAAVIGGVAALVAGATMAASSGSVAGISRDLATGPGGLRGSTSGGNVVNGSTTPWWTPAWLLPPPPSAAPQAPPYDPATGEIDTSKLPDGWHLVTDQSTGISYWMLIKNGNPVEINVPAGAPSNATPSYVPNMPYKTFGGGAATGGDVTVNLVVDGEVLANVVVDYLGKAMA